jgi:hypothetical protein
MGKRKRLVTFGCSFTFGHSLPDCIEVEQSWTQSSKYAWPEIVANKLNYYCVNESNCGASNLEILYRILNFKFDKDDTVVIMWTMPPRDILFQKSGQPFKQLGLWLTDKISKKWAVSVNEYDYIQRTWLYIHHAELYFKSLNLDYIHYPYPKIMTDVKSQINLEIDNLYLGGVDEQDKAVDGLHPGIKTHNYIADRIFNIINEKSK